MAVVLDACAMIAFLRDEPGAEIVESLLENERCLAHAVNVCELYYDFLKISDEMVAQKAVDDLLGLGLVIRKDMGRQFWQNIGKLKAEIRRISLADCFAVALGKKTDSDVVTSDHNEFDPIVGKKIWRIRFIR